jgi:hypothetical protein
MFIVLVRIKENSLGTNFNQENWMLVIWLVYSFQANCFTLFLLSSLRVAAFVLNSALK